MYSTQDTTPLHRGLTVETVAITHAQPRVFMAFPDQLARIRKEKGFTQKELADKVELHQSQIHRYESGASQPTLDALRKLALVLGITTDELVFEEDERGPDDELRLQFEAVSRFGPDEKKTAKDVLDGLILKHEARRWASSG